MTVLGGLQRVRGRSVRQISSSFNTDDGIRRATTEKMAENIEDIVCFNTDDGIRRATTVDVDVSVLHLLLVSIPMTVLGGLQQAAILRQNVETEMFQYR